MLFLIRTQHETEYCLSYQKACLLTHAQLLYIRTEFTSWREVVVHENGLFLFVLMAPVFLLSFPNWRYTKRVSRLFYLYFIIVRFLGRTWPYNMHSASFPPKFMIYDYNKHTNQQFFLHERSRIMIHSCSNSQFSTIFSLNAHNI